MKEKYSSYFKYGEKEVDIVIKQLDNNFNTAQTSSMGRVLDAVSVLLGISKSRGYEGECSMKLESVAVKSEDNLRITLQEEIINGKSIIDTSKLVYYALELLNDGLNKEDIACACQRSIAESMSRIAINTAKQYKVNTVGVTGGVFYNEFISNVVKEEIEFAGMKFVQHEQTCSGDGSVSMGQCAIAGWLKNNK